MYDQRVVSGINITHFQKRDQNGPRKLQRDYSTILSSKMICIPIEPETPKIRFSEKHQGNCHQILPPNFIA